MQERASRGCGEGGGLHSSSNGGWPLGLQPLHMHIQMLNVMSRATRSREAGSFSYNMTHHHHHRQLRYMQGDISPFFLSTYTPSISSLSSSDLDTESTGSFFPEKSTTLGTLIGIHSRSQRRQPITMDNVTTQLLQSKHMTKSQRLHACWCALTLIMKCACPNSDVNPIQESLSPSLAHLLELERKAAHTQFPQEESTFQCETSDLEDSNDQSSHSTKDLAHFDGVGECSHAQSTSTNTLFDGDGILPPKPFGAPLKDALHEFSTSLTTSSYISSDWSASALTLKKEKHYHASQGRLHTSLCPSFCKPN